MVVRADKRSFRGDDLKIDCSEYCYRYILVSWSYTLARRVEQLSGCTLLIPLMNPRGVRPSARRRLEHARHVVMGR